MVNDPISDMLTRIRNAAMASQVEAAIPVAGIRLEDAPIALGPRHEAQRPGPDGPLVEYRVPHPVDVRPRDDLAPHGQPSRDEHIRPLGVDDEGRRIRGLSPIERLEETAGILIKKLPDFGPWEVFSLQEKESKPRRGKR